MPTPDPPPRRRRFAAALLPALLAASQLLVFGPYAIHATNRAEQLYGFASLAAQWWPLLPAAVLALALVAALLPPRAAAAWTALTFAAGLLLWLQGNVLVVSYGPLDGSELDFARHAGRGRWELALWLALPLLAVAARRRLAAVAPFASGALLLLQLLALPWVGGAPPSSPPPSTAAPPPAIFSYAPRGNAIVLILDAFQSDVFAELVEGDDELARSFDGFTFYADHAGAFPTTKFSLPAMLSGIPYGNDEPAADYVARALDQRSVLGRLLAAGHEVDLASITQPFVRGPASHRWAIPRPFVGARQERRFAAAQLLDLSLFRHLPHGLKPWVYNHQRWRLQGRFDFRHRAYQAVNGKAVLDELTRRMTVVDRPPVVKFLHLGGAHLPIVVDRDCRFIGVKRKTRATYLAQARCALRPVSAYLDRLRRLGLYDSSPIVVASDHGVFLPPRDFRGRDAIGGLAPIAGQALPLLLIKPAGARGPLVTSQAPSAITDLPATLCDLLGVAGDAFPGRSILALEATAAGRRRVFGYYRWLRGDWSDPYLDALHRFRLAGPVADAESWSYLDSRLSPAIDFRVERLDFGHRSVRPHLGPGWHRAASRLKDGRRGWWAVGEEAVLFAALG
ncbi:MAG: hypothetical protein D6696_20900, partial [Acidobacteria bacterium]